MQVCIDIQPAVAQRAGVGRYVHSLVQHLAPLAGDDDLRAFYFDFRRKGSPFPAGLGLHEHAVRWLPGALVQQSWKRIGFPPYNWFAGSADLYHFTNYVIPPVNRRAKAVVSIHDAGYLKVPETLEPKNLAYLRHHIQRTVDRADLIITLNRIIAEELCEAYNLPPDRVLPIDLGLSDDFSPPPPERITEAKAAHALERPYLLHVGTLEPRKNHLFLLDVFERMDWFDGDLVLCGMRGWKNEAFEQRLAASPRRDRVRFPDYVSDEHLPALYAGAAAFLFPSLYEGFGLPPLEAMRCGCPVVSSAGGSLRDVVPPGGVVIEAFDAEEWSATLRPLIEDSDRRAQQITAGKQHAAGYTWDHTARETWKAYRQVAAR